MGKNKLEAFKGFLIPKMVALLVQVLLLHILDHHLFVLLIMVSGLAFGDFHTGIDYAAPTGTPIPAQHPGLVDWVQSSTIGLGEHVGIKVADNLWALYGHMSRIRAKMGDKVKAGQIVGDVGSSGWSTGPMFIMNLERWTKWPTRKS